MNSKPHRLMLIGWDAADWPLLNRLMDAGQMPALNRIVEEGASGRLLCADPPIAASQWTSIATGKRPWQHRVCHSLELAPNGRTFEPVTGSARHSVALWEMLARKGKRSIVVGWPTTHGTQAERVSMVSDRYPEPTVGPGVKPWPTAPKGTYWPMELGARLDRMRMSPEDLQADVLSLYIPKWQKIDQKHDRRLGLLRMLVAVDFSFQAAMIELVRRDAWDFAAVRFPALGQIARIFMPYHPPRRKLVGEEDFELYGGVMRAACRMLDLMLNRLVKTVGSETAVIIVSGHGVRAYDVSPKGLPPENDELWKSPYGIFAASGRGFVPDSLLHGATVMDVAPTVLTWFGLPIGEDMEGRVLLESFNPQPEIHRIESWEPCAEVASQQRQPGETSRPPDGSPGDVLRREYDWNFVRSCLEAAQYEKAMPVLEGLFREFPERPEFSQTLFKCQLELNRLSDAKQTLEVVLETVPAGIASALLRAELAWAERDVSLAHSLVEEALQLQPTNPAAMRRIGFLLLRLRQWDALEKLARQALALDDQEPVAWLGLAEALLRKRKAAEAVDAALKAIGLKYFLPDAHFVLVRALVAQGRWAEARDAVEALQKIQPDNRAVANYSKRIPQDDNR
jgi:predicted AlkP superfamily phosphohydrolase/phosphomutase